MEKVWDWVCVGSSVGVGPVRVPVGLWEREGLAVRVESERVSVGVGVAGPVRLADCVQVLRLRVIPDREVVQVELWVTVVIVPVTDELPLPLGLPVCSTLQVRVWVGVCVPERLRVDDREGEG